MGRTCFGTVYPYLGPISALNNQQTAVMLPGTGKKWCAWAHVGFLGKATVRT